MWELSPRVLSGCILTSKCHHMYLSTQHYHFLFISDSEHTCTKYEHESIIEVWKYVPKYSRQSQRQLTMTNTFREHLLRAIWEYYCIIQKTCEHWDTHYSMTFENNNLNIHCHPSKKSNMGHNLQFLRCLFYNSVLWAGQAGQSVCILKQAPENGHWAPLILSTCLCIYGLSDLTVPPVSVEIQN